MAASKRASEQRDVSFLGECTSCKLAAPTASLDSTRAQCVASSTPPPLHAQSPASTRHTAEKTKHAQALCRFRSTEHTAVDPLTRAVRTSVRPQPTLGSTATRTDSNEAIDRTRGHLTSHCSGNVTTIQHAPSLACHPLRTHISHSAPHCSPLCSPSFLSILCSPPCRPLQSLSW